MLHLTAAELNSVAKRNPSAFFAVKNKLQNRKGRKVSAKIRKTNYPGNCHLVRMTNRRQPSILSSPLFISRINRSR
jgi:hypothetical protein